MKNIKYKKKIKGKKFCGRCEIYKTLDKFNRSKMTDRQKEIALVEYRTKRDGYNYHHKCKDCEEEINFEMRFPAEAKLIKKRKKARKKAHEKYKEENKKKVKAHRAVQKAIKDGKIIKPKYCSNCNKTNCRIHGHHFNYDKQLDVVWLCGSCHKKLHAKLNKKLTRKK